MPGFSGRPVQGMQVEAMAGVPPRQAGSLFSRTVGEKTAGWVGRTAIPGHFLCGHAYLAVEGGLYEAREERVRVVRLGLKFGMKLCAKIEGVLG